MKDINWGLIPVDADHVDIFPIEASLDSLLERLQADGFEYQVIRKRETVKLKWIEYVVDERIRVKGSNRDVVISLTNR